jgi:D-arabinose 1-dehydrogenase-like Zn-dependent alcohol dehydrogenase
MRALSLIGSYVGNLAELTDLLAFAKRQGLPPIPTETVAPDGVNDALTRLEAGKVRGRVLIAHR